MTRNHHRAGISGHEHPPDTIDDVRGERAGVLVLMLNIERWLQERFPGMKRLTFGMDQGTTYTGSMTMEIGAHFVEVNVTPKEYIEEAID